MNHADSLNTAQICDSEFHGMHINIAVDISRSLSRFH